LLHFWRVRKEHARFAERDANALLEKFGKLAYEIAGRMARNPIDPRLPEGHWERVQRVISKIQRRSRPI
jgi:hypothetical protein